MKVQVSDNHISWSIADSNVSFQIDNLDQALFSEDQNVVAALVSENSTSRKIIIYDLNGKIRCEIEQPSEHYFNYLGPHIENDLAVMSKINKSGWRDWWFSINTKDGLLKSLGEGR